MTDKADSAENQPKQNSKSLVGQLTGLAGGITLNTLRLMARTGEASLKIGKSILSPERLDMMADTGRYLRDVREVAGLTIQELSEAVEIEDKTVLEAVEAGTATLSFELILRLAALLARHDPIPFVMRMTRTYNPALWQILDDWGIGRIPLQYERERQFINIMRSHDATRKLSDDGFEKVLDFTRSAFEMALHFVAEQENIEDHLVDPETEEPQS